MNFDDPRSKLFFEFVDILNHIKKHNPNVKFLLENVGMKKEYEEVITKALGHVPVKINSRKVSAQDRKRLYWANFYFTSPKDRNIKASDVIGCECFAGAMRGRRIDENGKRADSRRDLPIVQQIECRKDNKFNCVTTVSKDNVVVFSKERFFPAKENRSKWRYLTADEAEKLQTLPVGYTDCVSESARIKAIGNGYTDELTLDRIDNNGNYSPDNCRWVDMYVQANNKRNNWRLKVNGEIDTVGNWARRLNVSYWNLLHYAKGGKNMKYPELEIEAVNE